MRVRRNTRTATCWFNRSQYSPDVEGYSGLGSFASTDGGALFRLAEVYGALIGKLDRAGSDAFGGRSGLVETCRLGFGQRSTIMESCPEMPGFRWRVSGRGRVCRGIPRSRLHHAETHHQPGHNVNGRICKAADWAADVKSASRPGGSSRAVASAPLLAGRLGPTAGSAGLPVSGPVQYWQRLGFAGKHWNTVQCSRDSGDGGA